MIGVQKFGSITIDFYTFFIGLGGVISIILQGLYLWRKSGKVRYIWFVIPSFFYIVLGGFVGRLARALCYAPSSLKEWVTTAFGKNGVHFIGTVLLSTVFILPLILLTKMIIHHIGTWIYKKRGKTFGTDLEKGKTLRIVMNSTALCLFIQHAFNRIGCLSRGCCFGKPYTGFGAMKLPYSEVSYSTYPTHLIEILGMILCIFLVLYLGKKEKNGYGFGVLGYALVIFIAEFFMDIRGTVLFNELSGIQYVAILLFVIGGIYQLIYTVKSNRISPER